MTIAAAEGAGLVLHRRGLILAVTRRETTAFTHLIRGVVDSVFASKGVKLALHEEVEEEAGSGIVSHVTVEIDGPEERVALGRGGVREGDEI